MDRVNVIIVNGIPRAGKDSFVNFCLEELGYYGHAISTVDFIKKIAYNVGWDGQKTPEARKALSDLKDIFSTWLDASYNNIKKAIEGLEYEAVTYDLPKSNFFLFVHSREPQEIARFVKDFNAITVYIKRPNFEGEQQFNHADLNTDQYEYDYEVINGGTLKDLKELAKTFLAVVNKETTLEKEQYLNSLPTNCPYCNEPLTYSVINKYTAHCFKCDKNFIFNYKGEC